MKKLNHFSEDNLIVSCGTSHHRLLIIASFRELYDALGNPSHVGSGDEKIQVSWILYDEKNPNVAITIYDYRKRTSIYNIYEWNVGSKGLEEGAVLEALDGFYLKENVRKVKIEGSSILKEKII